MPRLYVETEGEEVCPIAFGGPSDTLVYFISLAFSTRYGATHELSQLALLLRGEHKVDLRPITTFADRNVEVDADQRELDRAWQDAAPLADSLRQTIAVLDAPDERVTALTADAPDLRDRLDDLRRMAEWAAGRNARVRLSFEL